jgi:hypothetical protein
MRRILIPLTVLLLACQTLYKIPPALTATQTEFPTAVATSISTPAATPKDSSPYTVRIHPDDGLYVGDLISFEIVAPAGHEDGEIEIQVDPPHGPIFGPQPFTSSSILNQPQAAFHFVWDTRDLYPGDYTIAFRILVDGPAWEQTVTLFPEDALPPYALNAEWESAESQCCIIYFLSGTSSQRDLQSVLAAADEQAAHVSQIMESAFEQPPTIVLMSRVIGHGGFSTDEIYVSYLDRNYAGSSFNHVLHHELVHILDWESGGEFRPTMLVEGMAVYLSGGHYKHEPLLPRAAALLDLDWYIPITTLIDDFYFQQHEIGYLEAGALIEFMKNKWGWVVFDNFYRSISLPENNSHYGALDSALRQYLGISLIELDALFFDALQNHQVDPHLKADVVSTVQFYDTVRRYQQALDNSAYFRTAWFLDIDDLLELDISADYLRHPGSPENMALETMLVSANNHLISGEFPECGRLLMAINNVLEKIDQADPDPFNADPLAVEYFDIVNMLLENGYQPQQIQIIENSARVLALAGGPELVELYLEVEDNVWSFD